MMLCYVMPMLNYFLVVPMLGFNAFGGPFPGQGSDDVIFFWRRWGGLLSEAQGKFWLQMKWYVLSIKRHVSYL